MALTEQDRIEIKGMIEQALRDQIAANLNTPYTVDASRCSHEWILNTSVTVPYEYCKKCLTEKYLYNIHNK